VLETKPHSPRFLPKDFFLYILELWSCRVKRDTSWHASDRFSLSNIFFFTSLFLLPAVVGDRSHFSYLGFPFAVRFNIPFLSSLITFWIPSTPWWRLCCRRFFLAVAFFPSHPRCAVRLSRGLAPLCLICALWDQFRSVALFSFFFRFLKDYLFFLFLVCF